MLKKLSIQNYALIEAMEISFSDGMTIITGETGAGKSILLGALSLLVGGRADASSLFRKSKKCIVEAEFLLKDNNLEQFFSDMDLDYENLTTIRREISSEGKSRAFINDSPVNLSILKDLGAKLIEIHSQHETLTLNDSQFQMLILDSFAGIEKKTAHFLSSLSAYNKALNNLKILQDREAQSKKDADYYNFLFTELADAKLISDEQNKLEQELEILNNSENIKSILASVQNALSGDENNLLAEINTITSSFQQLSKILPASESLALRIKSLQIEIKDIADEIDSLEREIVADPSKVEIINDRLDTIYKLQHKHRVKTVDELLSVYSELDSKLSGITFLEEEIGKLSIAITDAFETLVLKGEELHRLRSSVISEIENTISKMLLELGMKNAAVKIELAKLPSGQFRPTGTDTIKFLFSANKGIEFRELNKVASGGELSRLMLCIKSMLAKKTGLSTIIFDEIDSGISGEIANKVGNIVKEMSAERQVIAITHLPQMAGKGDEHLFVYKQTQSDITTTSIRKLNKPERIEQIAKMLSGEQPTKAAIANAKELLGVCE